MSHMARTVYDLEIGANEYGGAVADMKLAYRAIEPAGSPISQVHAMFTSLAHPVTAELPRRAGNLDHLMWTNPFSQAQSDEFFPDIFNRALDDYSIAAARFIEGVAMDDVTPAVPWTWTRSSTARNNLFGLLTECFCHWFAQAARAYSRAASFMLNPRAIPFILCMQNR